LQAIFSSLQKSKGEIVCILDSDDFFKKDKVKKIVSFFDKNKNEEILFDKPINYYGKNKKIESLKRFFSVKDEKKIKIMIPRKI